MHHFRFRREEKPDKQQNGLPKKSMKNLKNFPFLIAVLILGGLMPPVYAETLPSCPGALLISKEIKPYIQMAEAVESSLLPINGMALYRVFLDESGQPYSLDVPFAHIDLKKLKFIVAVGPAALDYLVKKPVNIPLFYGMVLNPDQIMADQDAACGVTLNLFTPSRIRDIQRIVPDIERLALLYNPVDNQIYRKVIRSFAQVEKMEAVPVEVFSESDIRPALKTAVEKADAFYFIPDSTVITPAIVKYIIKYGLSHSRPTIGYNRFFYESGALLSFRADYTGVGRQVAEMVQQFLESGSCRSEDPRAELLYNEKAAELLNIEINRKALPPENP